MNPWSPVVVVLLAAATAGATPSNDLPRTVQSLQDDTGGAATVVLHRTTGVAQLVRVEPGALELEGPTATTKSRDFLTRYGALLGVTDPERELEQTGSRRDRLGASHLRFHQRYHGLPVLGGELRAHFDPEGRIQAINGVFVPEITVDPAPRLPQATAEALAVALAAKPNGRAAGALAITDSELSVYRAGLVWGRPGADHLVWSVEVTDFEQVRELLLIDAHDGRLVERINGIHTLSRRIDEHRDGSTVWREGDPVPYSGGDAEANTEINRLIATAAEVHRLFANLSGGSFVGWDGSDGAMISVYDLDESDAWQCPNASWNGTRTAFCAGMTNDDIVAHEWTHAYSDSTHDLTYLYQSGALNESYSDIFGETVDLINGSGLDDPGAPRSANGCSTLASSPRPEVTVLAPPSVAGGYAVGPAQFNPAAPWTVTGQVEWVNDGADPTGDACTALVGFTAGRIALIDRGDCTFLDKARRAQEAGAIGVMVVNNQGDDLVNMAGEGALAIPSVFFRQSDGEAIKEALGQGVRATLSLRAATDQSVRWIVAEAAVVNGLRDMYNPACFGDPGKVSDGQYWCAFEDNGGVHHNSGVPNHGFALLVDGGSYNGRTVQGIGLGRAAHVYWRAMTEYQVHLTDFAMHADALELACHDLIGAGLTDLATGGPSPDVISAADCAQLSEAVAALELRQMPPCTPILRVFEPNPPPLTGSRVAFLDSFDAGPEPGWTVSNQGVYPEYRPRDWQWTADVPEGGSGGAMHAINGPVLGDCQAGSDDQSGVMQLTTPPITIPSGSDPVLAFDHYLSTERAFDGGNLRISVNGGPFELVPGSAFTFNSYNANLDPADRGNTNPMAGQPAFSGSDWGIARSDWGQSQVDLAGLVQAQDTIRLRFDFGADGCVGGYGWYLDNVQVRSTVELTLRRPARRLGL